MHHSLYLAENNLSKLSFADDNPATIPSPSFVADDKNYDYGGGGGGDDQDEDGCRLAQVVAVASVAVGLPCARLTRWHGAVRPWQHNKIRSRMSSRSN